MNDKTRHHNKGQADASGDKGYKPPHGMVEELLFGWGDSGKKMAEDNTAYKEGYEHAKSKK